MKTRQKILEYVRKNPMSTVEEITGGLGINYETVIASLNTLKRRGKIKATDSCPAKYAVSPQKPTIGYDGLALVDYVERLNWENQELKAEINCLHGELNECQRKLVRLAQRIVRQDIYGKY